MDTEEEWTRQERRRAVERLSVRDRPVITLRCGRLDEQDQTLEEVSQLLQVTPEHVHQWEKRAWRT
ncbi:MAG TPA: sigma factor-like helix-turn-helix DNA-binding protein [Ktedonobacteraceae bacterium]|jgi:DNA-directed RNA polymerase sigma subunit (sigma70/sigma32)